MSDCCSCDYDQNGIFVRPSRPVSTEGMIGPLIKVRPISAGMNELGLIQVRDNLTCEKYIYFQQDKGTEINPVLRLRVMSSDHDQNACVGDDLADILKNVRDKFGRKLKPDKIEYYRKMETAILSESALAEDWLTPEEDEAWKDL